MLNRILARLRDILDHGPGGVAQSPDNENPLGLSDAEMRTLRGFKDSPEYDVWLKTLDRTINLYSENLLAADRDQLADIRGILVGLRMAGTLVQNLTSQEEDLHARDRARAAEERARSLDRAAYGSPTGRDRFNDRSRSAPR